MTYGQQSTALNSSLNQIRSLLPISPIKTFIPPFNNFNQDTINILKMYGITHLSAQVQTDITLPYLMTGQNFYRFPIGASTNDDQNENVFIGIPANKTYNLMRSQLAANGFAAGIFLCIFYFMVTRY